MSLLRRLIGLGAAERPSDAETPQALVYRGPATLPGCPEAVAESLHRAGLEVGFVGPGERLPLTAQTLAGAAIYAQPGGGELDEAWRHMRAVAPAIRGFVADGGGYLGYCLGAYLAGDDPGFDLLPGQVDQYIVTPGAGVLDESDALVTLDWRGSERTLYFQDGAYVDVRDDAEAEIVARYDNGRVAALVCPYGRGRVGVVGPHPEATRDWFTDVGLRPPRPLAVDLAVDLVERLDAPRLRVA